VFDSGIFICSSLKKKNKLAYKKNSKKFDRQKCFLVSEEKKLFSLDMLKCIR
jgi:hypothetical protein